jgi:hypothetical protein
VILFYVVCDYSELPPFGAEVVTASQVLKPRERNMSMNPDVKAKWTTALRSGKYRQGHGFLRVKGQNGADDRFCCLGVLCELAVEAGVTKQLNSGYETRYGVSGDSNTAVLPGHVRQWAGMDSHAGSYDNGDRSLTGDNDGGVPFSDIADIIEKNF